MFVCASVLGVMFSFERVVPRELAEASKACAWKVLQSLRYGEKTAFLLSDMHVVWLPARLVE